MNCGSVEKMRPPPLSIVYGFDPSLSFSAFNFFKANEILMKILLGFLKFYLPLSFNHSSAHKPQTELQVMSHKITYTVYLGFPKHSYGHIPELSKKIYLTFLLREQFYRHGFLET